MKRVFVDTDVVIDLLCKREPFDAAAARVFSLGESGKLELAVSALTFSHVHYYLRKLLSAKDVINALAVLAELVDVLSVDKRVIKLALSSKISDFEDAIQYYTAISHNIDVLVTRNIKDYKHAEISIQLPSQFLNSCRLK